MWILIFCKRLSQDNVREQKTWIDFKKSAFLNRCSLYPIVEIVRCYTEITRQNTIANSTWLYEIHFVFCTTWCAFRVPQNRNAYDSLKGSVPRYKKYIKDETMRSHRIHRFYLPRYSLIPGNTTVHRYRTRQTASRFADAKCTFNQTHAREPYH